MFEKLQRWYQKGYYTQDQVHRFVDKGIITEEEYRAICEGNTAS